MIEDYDDLDHNLTNHPPVNTNIIASFEIIREAVDHCPPSRERSLAITNLEHTVMWAVAAIARNQPDD